MMSNGLTYKHTVGPSVRYFGSQSVFSADQILQGGCKPRPFHFTTASGETDGFLDLEQSCTVIELSYVGHTCTEMTPEHSHFWSAFSPGGTHVDKQKGSSQVTFLISTNTFQSRTTSGRGA